MELGWIDFDFDIIFKLWEKKWVVFELWVAPSLIHYHSLITGCGL